MRQLSYAGSTIRLLHTPELADITIIIGVGIFLRWCRCERQILIFPTVFPKIAEKKFKKIFQKILFFCLSLMHHRIFLRHLYDVFPFRFLHTRTYTNTNFCFGTDPWHRPTVYVDQYTSDTSPAALAAKARRQGAPSGNEGFSKEEQKARLQRTNFIVGNDELKRTTSYYHSYMTSQPKPTPCHPAPPPERSQVWVFLLRHGQNATLRHPSPALSCESRCTKKE